MTIDDVQKLNKITRVLRLICKEFKWMPFWKPFIAPFITNNRDRILALYDDVEEMMREE